VSVAVVLPWRSTDCPHRTRALAFVIAKHAGNGWPVVIGRHDEDAWIKAAAIDDALAQTQAEILILADADVWCHGIAAAVARVEAGAPWAIPHKGVQRLTEASTSRYLAGEPWERLPLTQAAYSGTEGGGFVVVRRDVYEACPLDPRYVGWGQEDESLGWALTTLYGRAWRGKAALVHLWHPPQPRMSRVVGSEESAVLRKRYARALRNPSAMAALIEEAHDAHRALESAVDDRPAFAR
jgi:hypothetical protein